MSRSFHSDLAIDALEMALWARGRNAEGLVHHSDRRSQYLSIRYCERLAQAGAPASVGSRGDSYDNALVETINGLATLEWVDGFINRLLLEPIGDIPPAEYEMLYWTESGSTDTVGLTELSLH